MIFIYLGDNIFINEKDIIAIVDINNLDLNQDNQSFLEIAQKKIIIREKNEQKATMKTMIVTTEVVYLLPVSVHVFKNHRRCYHA